VSEAPEDPEEVEELEPDKEWSHRIQVPFKLDNVLDFSNQRESDGRQHEKNRDDIHIVPDVTQIPPAGGLVLELDVLVRQEVKAKDGDDGLDEVSLDLSW